MIKEITLTNEEVKEALESYWGRRKVGHCIEVVTVTPVNSVAKGSYYIVAYTDDK